MSKSIKIQMSMRGEDWSFKHGKGEGYCSVPEQMRHCGASPADVCHVIGSRGNTASELREEGEHTSNYVL